MDLHAVAVEEQQLRGERKAAVSGLAIAEASAEKHRAEIARIDARVGELEAATLDAFKRTRGVALPADDLLPEQPFEQFGVAAE